MARSPPARGVIFSAERAMVTSFAPALARTASGKLQKQAIRSSLGSLPVV